MALIRETKEEQEKNPMTEEEMLRESEDLAHYGVQQAKKPGIKPKDINRIIYESRKRRRTQLIVPGDRHLRRLRTYEGIPIVRPVDFLRTLGIG